jgi:hypothetical protein
MKRRLNKDKKRLEITKNLVKIISNSQTLKDSDFTKLEGITKIATKHPELFEFDLIPRKELQLYSQIFHFPLMRPNYILSRRLVSHFAHIKRDDSFIKNSSLQRFTLNQIIECLDERGIPSTDIDFENAKMKLLQWLELTALVEPVIPPGLVIQSSLIRSGSE